MEHYIFYEKKIPSACDEVFLSPSGIA